MTTNRRYRPGTLTMEPSSSLPLSLQILRTVQSFGKIPRGLLYDKVSASSKDIDQRLLELAKQGAIKVDKEKDLVIAK
jgi:hypothetical protein